MNLTNIESKISNLEQETSELKGRVNTLEDLFIDTEKKLKELKSLVQTNKKAIELLTLVQKATKELVQNSFEEIVSNALQFIHQDSNYKFELDFDKRGNLSTLNFNIKTPDMQESHDILNTRGGGTADIVSLALRLVLLEVSKTHGFVLIDEGFKHLDNTDTEKKAMEFLKEVQKNSNRQIILITHKDSIVEEVENPIVIK